MSHGADPGTVAMFKKIAGVGPLTVRCSRILAVCREDWWGQPARTKSFDAEQAAAYRLELEAVRAAWRDHDEWRAA